MDEEWYCTGSILICQNDQEIKDLLRRSYISMNEYCLIYKQIDIGLEIGVKGSYAGNVYKTLESVINICKKKNIEIEGKLTFHEDSVRHLKVSNYEAEYLFEHEDILGNDIWWKIKNLKDDLARWNISESHTDDITFASKEQIQDAVDKMQAIRTLKESSLCDGAIGVISSFI